MFPSAIAAWRAATAVRQQMVAKESSSPRVSSVHGSFDVEPPRRSTRKRHLAASDPVVNTIVALLRHLRIRQRTHGRRPLRLHPPSATSKDPEQHRSHGGKRATLHSSPRFIFPGQSRRSSYACGFSEMRGKASHMGGVSCGRRPEDVVLRPLPRGCTNFRQTGKDFSLQPSVQDSHGQRNKEAVLPTSLPLSVHTRSPSTPLSVDLDDAIVLSSVCVDLAPILVENESLVRWAKPH